jgi:glycine betaine/proline transport system substrate-binding protein
MARIVAAIVMCVLASACTSSADLADRAAEPSSSAVSEVSNSSTTTSTTITITTTRAPIEPHGPVRVIRPTWDSAMVANSIVMVLLENIGYDVEDVSVVEGTSNDLLFDRLARSDADVTLDGWFPGNVSWLESPVRGKPDSTVGDLLTIIEPPLQPAGGIQGFLIAKSWAEAEGITHIGQINDDPSLAAALDADGDGLGEIFGCPQDWTCDDIISAFIYFNEWESLEQTMYQPTTLRLEPYDAMFAEFLARVDRGEPAIAYTWAPTSYYADAAIGEKTVWLSVTDEAALNGTRYMHDNPHDPQDWLLNPDGTAGFTDIPSAICTQGPDGCQLGWKGSDIHAVANTEWLEANPSAHALIEAIELDTVEMSDLLVELEQLELEEWPDRIDASMGIARQWVDAHPDRVNTWLDATR